MDTFKEIFIERKLLKPEYEQLLEKGYLGLKVSLHHDAFQLFQRQFGIGDEIVFHTSGGQQVTTRITSIDVGEFQDDTVRVFVGFAAV